MTPRTAPQLRLARPTRDIEAAIRFYTGALGWRVLGAFADHAGFDGVMLGHRAWPYHLELTRHRSRPTEPRPTDEDLLVFYLPVRAEWAALVRRLREQGARFVASSNPYWEDRGVTIEDPDGYRIVLEHDAWA